VGFQHNKNRMKFLTLRRSVRRATYQELLRRTYWHRRTAQDKPRRMDFTSIFTWAFAQGEVANRPRRIFSFSSFNSHPRSGAASNNKQHKEVL
jgi:hypothetical protein